MTYYEGKKYCCPFIFDYPEHGCECEKEHEELYEKLKDNQDSEVFFHSLDNTTLKEFFKECDPAPFGGIEGEDDILGSCDFRLFENKKGKVEVHLMPPLKFGDYLDGDDACCCEKCEDVIKSIQKKHEWEKKYDEKKEDIKRFDEWREKTHPNEEAFWYEENEECPNPDPWQKSSYNSFEEAIVGEYGDKSEQAKQYSVGMFAPK